MGENDTKRGMRARKGGEEGGDAIGPLSRSPPFLPLL